jgi:hypothetical protein
MEKLPTFVSGVRSVAGSNGKSLLVRRETRVVDDSSANSDPSGVPFLTISPGTAPNEPVRLSTTARRLVRRCSWAAIARATASAPPPRSKPTMMRVSFSRATPCACAYPIKSAGAARLADVTRRRRFIDTLQIAGIPGNEDR